MTAGAARLVAEGPGDQALQCRDTNNNSELPGSTAKSRGCARLKRSKRPAKRNASAKEVAAEASINAKAPENLKLAPSEPAGGPGAISNPASGQERSAPGRAQLENAVTARLMKTKMCYFFERGKCASQNCRYAHSHSELRVQPNLQKTKLCKVWAQDGFCAEGENCVFAHGEAELRVTDGIYKTQMCHFFEKGRCLKGERCNHAHGFGDLRAPVPATSTMQHGNSPETRAPSASIGLTSSGSDSLGGSDHRSPLSPLPLAELLPMQAHAQAQANVAAAAAMAQLTGLDYTATPALFGAGAMPTWGIPWTMPPSTYTTTAGTPSSPHSCLLKTTPSPESRAGAAAAATSRTTTSANSCIGATPLSALGQSMWMPSHIDHHFDPLSHLDVAGDAPSPVSRQLAAGTAPRTSASVASCIGATPLSAMGQPMWMPPPLDPAAYADEVMKSACPLIPCDLTARLATLDSVVQDFSQHLDTAKTSAAGGSDRPQQRHTHHRI